jgi:hypothetical protein
MILHHCGIRVLFLDHILDHKSINSGTIEEFETDPRSRKYLETFCQLRLFATSLLQNSFAMILHPCGIRILFLDHISDHKSINSSPIEEFETDPRPRKFLDTFCQLRLFATPLLQNSFVMISHNCGIWTTYRTTSPSILVQFKNLKQIQGLESTSKLSAYSDCLQLHCFKIPFSSVHAKQKIAFNCPNILIWKRVASILCGGSSSFLSGASSHFA